MLGETVQCPHCDFASSETTVAYHLINRHAELLEWEPFGALPDATDAARAAECDCPVSSGEGAWREAHDPTCPAARGSEDV